MQPAPVGSVGADYTEDPCIACQWVLGQSCASFSVLCGPQVSKSLVRGNSQAGPVICASITPQLKDQLPKYDHQRVWGEGSKALRAGNCSHSNNLWLMSWFPDTNVTTLATLWYYHVLYWLTYFFYFKSTHFEIITFFHAHSRYHATLPEPQWRCRTHMQPSGFGDMRSHES